MSLLEVTKLSVKYGAAEALREVSLHVDAGEVVTIIGSNGAGKTTTLRAVTGMLLPGMTVRGKVTFDGKEITGASSHSVARRGLVHVPEGRRVFPSASVEENLLLGSYRLRRREKSAARNARVEVVARAHSEAEEAELRAMGAMRVVVAERELGNELVRHALRRFGVSEREVAAILDARHR